MVDCNLIFGIAAEAECYYSTHGAYDEDCR